MSTPLHREGTIVASALRPSGAASIMSDISTATLKERILNVKCVVSDLRGGKFPWYLATVQAVL